MTDADSHPKGRHDEFFKGCFEDLAVARAFFEHYLPPDILAQLDLNKIALKRGSFIDEEELRQSYSDLLYTLPLRGESPDGNSPKAYIYILVEHKSWSDEFTVFQLLRYMMRIWDRELKEAERRPGFRLPPILPLIFHHGRMPFHAPVEFHKVVAMAPGLEPFIPSYRCLLVDLKALAPEDLPSGDERLHAILAVMRSVFVGAEIHATLKQWVARFAAVIDNREIYELLRKILNYTLQSAHDLSDEEFMAAIEPLRKAKGDVVSTLIQQWMDEGREEGLSQGLERGREEGREEGRLADRRDSILDFLAARFGSVSESLRDAVLAISDGERLVRLTKEAATCESIEQFAECLK